MDNNLYVVKNNKKIQPFDYDKIKIVLEKISDEIKEPLTESDLNNIIKEIQNIIKQNKNKIIASTEIKKYVTVALNKLGFRKIANNY